MEEQEKLEALLEMFSTKGWEIFKEEINTTLGSLKESAYIDCADEVSWQVRRGEILKLTQFANYESYIRQVMEQDDNADLS